MAAAAVLFSTFCPPSKVEEERNGFPSRSEMESQAVIERRSGSCAVAVFGSENLLFAVWFGAGQGRAILSAGERILL